VALCLVLALCYPSVRWPMYSLHRFVLVLFPVFVAEALVTRRVFPLRWVLLAFSAAGLVWYTLIFAAFAHLG
jgi:inner membrane protein involved in colicin E2 resistance